MATCFFESGDHELFEERARGGRVGEVDGRVRHQHVGADDARQPVAGADGVVGREPAVERRRDRVADCDEDTVARAEREVAEHCFGLVGEEELERVVLARARARRSTTTATTASAKVAAARPAATTTPAMRSCSATTALRTISGLPSK